VSVVADEGAIRFDDSFVLEVDRSLPDVEPVVRIIDAIHTLYARSFLSYLAEWEPYTDAKTVRLRTLARRIRQAGNEHMIELAHLLETFGRAPESRSFRKQFADENYTTWTHVLPALFEMLQRQVAILERALHAITGLAGEDRTRPVLDTQLKSSRAFLAELEKCRLSMNIA
jgi:hypothetical protein